MEEALARQLAQTKVTDERRKREIEKLCGESDELKELQAKIKAAYLNKERSQQMTEKQYRVQSEIVSSTFSKSNSIRETSFIKGNDSTFILFHRSKMQLSTSRC